MRQAIDRRWSVPDPPILIARMVSTNYAYL